jgi:hypothetical protein
MGLENDPFLNDVAEIAMEEKVDSVLDGRAFNTEMVQAKMAALIAANPQPMANMQTTLHQNVAKEMDEYAPADPALGGSYGGGYGTDENPNNFGETHADGGWGNN